MRILEAISQQLNGMAVTLTNTPVFELLNDIKFSLEWNSSADTGQTTAQSGMQNTSTMNDKTMITPILVGAFGEASEDKISQSNSPARKIIRRESSVRLLRQTSKFGAIFNVDQQNTEQFVVQSIIGT